MLKSMTGWGDASASRGGTEVRAELKSVNNRYLDCNVRLPRAYLSTEEAVKTAVGRVISRGKVDVFITVDASAEDSAPKLNLALARAYVDAAERLGVLGVDTRLRAADILRFPDVMAHTRSGDAEEQTSALILEALGDALTAFDASRRREGEKLGADIRRRSEELLRLVATVESRSARSAEEYRAKLEARLREILADRAIDETRIVTEAAIFADKTAVSEEVVRLRSHLGELERTLGLGEAVGRRLDFLVQELNREANTIGSKCSDAELAGTVVDIKAEIEKIREQAANLE
ncbi:MAG: YicC family protein [Oscillospiraceae bacterium]|jgi:uncharacterized protein (TIGR00255 family)|nr:YicC family protein [Oscillospiraceae bacterium]